MSTPLALRIAAFALLALPFAYAEEGITADALLADTPMTTVGGNTFIAPSEWTVTVRGRATFIEAPEGGSRIVLVDVDAEGAEEALQAGWAAYRTNNRPRKTSQDQPDRRGWSKRRRYDYLTSPNERRSIAAGVRFANELWTVWIYDMADELEGKRSAQIRLVFGSLLPRGYSRETFADRKANPLGQSRIAELTRFIQDGQKAARIPGVSLGLVQGGKVVYAGGFGVREIGKAERVDADTLYMIASITKPLTTLLLARLVDAGELTWTTPVTTLLPSFRLGDSDTTSRVLVKHLICACTGLPRRDFEFIFGFDGRTPDDALSALASVQPTSEFGDMYQYSNGLAAAAGFVAGHVLYPEMDIGSAYDRAMQEQVFDPLGMGVTTFDFASTVAGNNASAHGPNIDSEATVVDPYVNYGAVYTRPSAGAWSSVDDLLKYVAMELSGGLLPNEHRYVSEELLVDRRTPTVAIGVDRHYGMGLEIDKTYGVPVIRHAGAVFGYHSEIFWLPEQGVGAVILTNGITGRLLTNGFRRKLLEVLFDGEPKADASLRLASDNFYSAFNAASEHLSVPVEAALRERIASRYRNYALGDIEVIREGRVITLDFGGWKSEVGSRENPDGSHSLVTIAPGVVGFEFVIDSGEDRTLTLREAQHEYVFAEIEGHGH